jgi:hypothetical protein
VSILVLHHANKLNPSDFRDSASGAMSLIGGADNHWSLKREALGSDAVLRITGRDVEEQELAMQFKDGYWSVLGTAVEVYQSHERKAILEVLKASPKPMTPTQIAKALGKNVSTVKILVRKMLDAGVIIQPHTGHYTVNPINPINPVNPVNPVNPGVQERPVYGGGADCKPIQPIETLGTYDDAVYGFTGFTVPVEPDPPIAPGSDQDDDDWVEFR